MTKPPPPPSDNPFLPKSIELTSLDGETDLDSLSELDDAAVQTIEQERKTPPPQIEGFGTDVDWDGGEIGDHAGPEHSGQNKADLGEPMFAASLANLDGSDDQDRVAPTPPTGPDPFGPPLDLSAPVASEPAAAAKKSEPVGHATAGNRPAAGDAFKAPSYEDVPIQLNMSLGQMVSDQPKDNLSEKLPEQIELAVPDPNAFIPIPGRFMEGRLRQNPSMHILIGLALALGIGYVVARPVQRRSEMRIEYLRQQAAGERARNHEEAVAAAEKLDAKAESESTKAFVLVAGLWVGISGGLFALYYRFT